MEDMSGEIAGFIRQATVDAATDDRVNNGVGPPADGIKIDFDGKEEPLDR